MKIPDIVYTGAVFSKSRSHRYALYRYYHGDRYVMFVCLNPSTATETKNDPTVRRCIGYAHQWGFGGVVVCNIFAYRATDPKDMESHDFPIEEECEANDYWINWFAKGASRIVCSWGNHGQYLDQGEAIHSLIYDYRPFCFGVTKAGHPKHPLYLASDCKLERY